MVTIPQNQLEKLYLTLAELEAENQRLKEAIQAISPHIKAIENEIINKHVEREVKKIKKILNKVVVKDGKAEKKS